MTLQDTLTSFIESVKQKELLTSVLAIVKVELPEVYAALIGTYVTRILTSIIYHGCTVTPVLIGPLARDPNILI